MVLCLRSWNKCLLKPRSLTCSNIRLMWQATRRPFWKKLWLAKSLKVCSADERSPGWGHWKLLKRTAGEYWAIAGHFTIFEQLPSLVVGQRIQSIFVSFTDKDTACVPLCCGHELLCWLKTIIKWQTFIQILAYAKKGLVDASIPDKVWRDWLDYCIFSSPL